MKKVLVTLFGVCLSVFVWAQSSASLSGFVKVAGKGEIIQYGTVVLYKNNNVYQDALTDENGRFDYVVKSHISSFKNGFHIFHHLLGFGFNII